MTLEERIMLSQKDQNHPERNALINEYTPFIIKTITGVTNRYVSKENSEELIVGMEAFNEAIDRYEESRGNFISYAGLVIRSRINDWLRKDRYYDYHTSLPQDFDVEDETRPMDEKLVVQEEIAAYIHLLERFGIDLESLADEAPTHQRTRQENIVLGRKIADDEPIVKKLYDTRKLPMAAIVLKYQTTKRKLKSHRNFLISLIVLYKEKYQRIMSFIEDGGDWRD